MEELPEEILPPGMNAKRQRYLNDQVRPFYNCTLSADMTCRFPNVPKAGAPNDPQSTGKKSGATDLEIESTPKRTHSCGYCKEIGHFKSKKGVITCPKYLED